MKVLIYSEYFSPVVGGVQTAVDLLARGLATYPREKFSQAEESIEVTVVTRTAGSGVSDSALSYRVVRRPNSVELVRLIRQAELIHVAGPCFLPLAVAIALRKPTVIEHHGYQAICPNGLLFMEPSRTLCPGHFMSRRYGQCLQCCAQTMGWLASARQLALMFPRRWLCQRVAANITISDHVGRRLKLPRGRTIYYGTANLHSRSAASEQRSCPPGPASRASAIELGYVGRFVTEKGVAVLLEAAGHLKRHGVFFCLTLIGDGPEREHLEELVAKLGLNDHVTFTGDLRGGDLEETVSGIDVVVMPSVCEETLGMSAIEQMMRGRVVVAAAIGGLSEVVGDAGLKFPAGDSLALAQCIECLAGDPTLMAALGSSAFSRAQRLFSQGGMVEAHVRLYRQVLLGREGLYEASNSAARGEVRRETNYP